jgi:hypothetical protein
MAFLLALGGAAFETVAGVTTFLTETVATAAARAVMPRLAMGAEASYTPFEALGGNTYMEGGYASGYNAFIPNLSVERTILTPLVRTLGFASRTVATRATAAPIAMAEEAQLLAVPEVLAPVTEETSLLTQEAEINSIISNSAARYTTGAGAVGVGDLANATFRTSTVVGGVAALVYAAYQAALAAAHTAAVVATAATATVTGATAATTATAGTAAAEAARLQKKEEELQKKKEEAAFLATTNGIHRTYKTPWEEELARLRALIEHVRESGLGAMPSERRWGVANETPATVTDATELIAYLQDQVSYRTSMASVNNYYTASSPAHAQLAQDAVDLNHRIAALRAGQDPHEYRNAVAGRLAHQRDVARQQQARIDGTIAAQTADLTYSQLRLGSEFFQWSDEEYVEAMMSGVDDKWHQVSSLFGGHREDFNEMLRQADLERLRIRADQELATTQLNATNKKIASIETELHLASSMTKTAPQTQSTVDDKVSSGRVDKDLLSHINELLASGYL